MSTFLEKTEFMRPVWPYPFQQVVQQHEGAFGDVVAHGHHFEVFRRSAPEEVHQEHVEDHLVIPMGERRS